jgi:hypothetical protein
MFEVLNLEFTGFKVVFDGTYLQVGHSSADCPPNDANQSTNPNRRKAFKGSRSV